MHIWCACTLYSITYSIVLYWKSTALVNTYTHVYFNNFINSFRYLYYFTCAHIYPHFPGPSSLAYNRRTYIFSWLVTTHFYISFNIIIIVFVDKISPKSNSLIAFIMCWPSSHLVVRRLRRTYIIYHPWPIQIISCFCLAVTRVDHRVRTLLQNRQYTCKYPLIYCVNYNIHTRYNLCIRYIYYTVQPCRWFAMLQRNRVLHRSLLNFPFVRTFFLFLSQVMYIS